MKKNYLLAAMALFAFTVNAQFEDDFESYDLGDIASQSDRWRTWSDADGTGEDADVSNNQSSNGDNSVFVAPGNDMLLFFGEGDVVSQGIYTWEYKAYFVDQSSGFIGPMGEAANQDTFGASLYHNLQAEGPAVTLGTQIVADGFTIPQETWTTFSWEFDLDANTLILRIDDVEVYNGDSGLSGALDAVDIWSEDAGTNFYMDEVRFVEGTLATNDVSFQDLSLYPNPAQDRITISTQNIVNEVRIIDVLGKVVLQKNINETSPSINVERLATGTYIVQVFGEGLLQSTKLIKR